MKMKYTPYSPGLALCGWFLFCFIKRNVISRIKFKDVEGIKTVLLHTILKEEFQKCFDQ